MAVKVPRDGGSPPASRNFSALDSATVTFWTTACPPTTRIVPSSGRTAEVGNARGVDMEAVGRTVPEPGLGSGVKTSAVSVIVVRFTYPPATRTRGSGEGRRAAVK